MKENKLQILSGQVSFRLEDDKYIIKEINELTKIRVVKKEIKKRR